MPEAPRSVAPAENVEGLKLLKDSMDPARYAAELEKLATELALKTRQIRETGGKQP